MEKKLVLITGASSGIGAETARRFARLGHTVLLLARDEQRLNTVADEIAGSGGQAFAFPLDVGSHEAVVDSASAIKRRFGVPDIIINNAGGGKWRFVEETEYEEAIEMIAAPYLGAFFVTKAFMPEMLERDSGHIVNVTSFAAFTPFSGATGYIASRKAMLGFHEALSADLYRTNIKTSLAYFAKVQSSFWEHNPGSEERLPVAQKLIPVITEGKAAEAIVRGVGKGKHRISAPFMLRVIEVLIYTAPFVTRFIMNNSGYKRSAGR